MDEKIIGLKVRLIGEKDTLDAATNLSDKLELSAKVLQEIEKGKAFDKQTGRIKNANKALDDYIKKLEQMRKLEGKPSTTTRQSSPTSATGNQNAERAKQTTAALRREAIALKEQGKNYDDLVEQLARTRLERQKLNKEIREQSNEFQAVDEGIGAYKQLSAQFAIARERAKDLQAQYKATNTEFDETVDEAIADAKRLNDQLKEIDGNVGNFQRNVGNYPSTIGSAFQSVFPVFGEFNDGLEGIGNTVSKTGKAIATSFFVITIIQQLFQGIQALDEFADKFNEVRGEVQTLTGTIGDDLTTVTSKIIAISNTFDQDYNEVLRAGNTLSREFGISQEEAFERIATGFEAGLDSSKQFLDNVSEYSAQFAASEASADQFFSVLQRATQEGIYSDKGADLVKEFGLRIREQTTATRDALEGAFGEEFTSDLFDNLNDGSINTIDALEQVSGALNSVELTAEQTQTVIADVFGGPGEDAGLRFIQSLSEIDGSLENIIGGFNEYQQAQRDLRQANERLAEQQSLIAQEFFNASQNSKLFGTNLKTFALTAVNEFFADVRQVRAEISGIGAALGVISENIVLFFRRAAIDVQILGKEIAKANPFGKTTEQLESEIVNLRNLRAEFVNEGETIAEAYDSAFEARLGELETRKALNDEVLRQQELTKQNAEFEKQASEKQKKAIEEAAKARIEAAKNLAKLEEDLIQNRFDLQAAQAQSGASDQIAALIGDPAQIERQTILIREKLQQQLVVIERTRQEAQQQALQRVRQYSNELVQLQAQTAASLSENELSVIDQVFAIDEQEIQADFQAGQALLLDLLQSNEITYQEYNDRVQNAVQTREEAIFEIERSRAEEQLQLLDQFAQQRIAQLQAEFELEQQLIEQRRAARNEQINNDFGSGDLTEEQRNLGIEDSDTLAQEQEIAALRSLEQAKLDIINETAQRTIEIETAVIEQQNELRQKNLAELRQYQRQQERIVEQTNEALGEAVGEFLSGQIESVKDFNKQILIIALEAVEKQALLAIAQATAREIGSKGFIGIGTAALLTGLIKAATAGLRSAINNFELGGTIGGVTPIGSGVAIGRMHHDGGIRFGNNEVQHGEYMLRNGDRTHVINTRSTRKFKPALSKLAKQTASNKYSPQRERLASSINAFNGWGRKFNDGGTFLNTSTLQAPILPANTDVNINTDGLQQQQQLTLELINAVQQSINATNSRIDNLRVINRADETVAVGNELLEVENQRSL